MASYINVHGKSIYCQRVNKTNNLEVIIANKISLYNHWPVRAISCDKNANFKVIMYPDVPNRTSTSTYQT